MTRLGRLESWLEALDLRAALVTDPASVSYLVGFRANTRERLMAAVVRPGSTVLVVPALELDNASASATGIEVMGWSDGEDPAQVLDSVLGATGRVAVEKSHLTLVWADRLRVALGKGELVDVGEQIRRWRAVKGPEELEKLGLAAGLTDRVLDGSFTSMMAGENELEIANLVATTSAGLGAPLSFDTLAQSGPNSALPHLEPGSRRLGRGDLVLLDLGVVHEGYSGDITRVGVVGEPSDRQLEIHRLVLEAHDRALAAIRPGVTAGAVDAAARSVIETAGLGSHFLHRTGHGLGLEIHEAPSLEPGSELVLEAGMVVTVEPGVYLPGWGGIRIEDMAAVVPEGVRLLTHSDRSLRIITC